MIQPDPNSGFSSELPTELEDAKHCMQLALELAERGRGSVEPNPMVGCVLVKESTDDRQAKPVLQVLGVGFHTRFGGPHAEREAIADAQRRGNSQQLEGATAYVTLEPCCHHGKTPPCTDALIAVGISKVVVAMLDPFEQVSGRGVELLRRHGIAVDVGLDEASAQQLNAPYLKRLRQQRPWILAKWAMSLDGKTATRMLHSQWISNADSRAHAHALRGECDAILVGIGTALADDPLLTARGEQPPPRTAVRVVVDSSLRLPPSSRLAQTAHDAPVLVWCGPTATQSTMQSLQHLGCRVEQCTAPEPNDRLDQLLLFLTREYRATNVLVEGGGGIVGSLLDIGQIDETLVFVAPKLIGGIQAVAATGGRGFGQVDDGPRPSQHRIQAFGEDLLIRTRWDWTKASN